MLAHWQMQSKSYCSSVQEGRLGPAQHLYANVSSAKSAQELLTTLGRSLKNTTKSKGPSTEPCGTPEEIGLIVERTPLTTVLMERPDCGTMQVQCPRLQCPQLLQKWAVINPIQCFSDVQETCVKASELNEPEKVGFVCPVTLILIKFRPTSS